MTGFVESGLGARRVAVLYSPTPGAAQLARRQREIFDRAGVRILVHEPLTAGLTDFGPLLKRVVDQASDVLISTTFFDERGDPVSYERVILQIQGGRHVVVWPKERAQAATR